jgi:hypothetical protein
MTAEELEGLREKAFREFYLRPAFLLRALETMRSPRVLVEKLAFLRWFRK